MKRPWIAAIILATILIVYRILSSNVEGIANFSPFAAFMFCGAAFWHTNKWLLPTAMIAWFVSSPLSNILQDYSLFSAFIPTFIGFACVIGIGYLFSKKRTSTTIIGSLVAATAFYAVTNTICFFTDPIYPKTLEGYTQAMWTGSIYGPTWPFFRNGLLSAGLFTSLFLAIMAIPAIRKATGFRLSPAPTR